MVLPAEGQQECLHAPLGELGARIGTAGQVIGDEQRVEFFPYVMMCGNVHAKTFHSNRR